MNCSNSILREGGGELEREREFQFLMLSLLQLLLLIEGRFRCLDCLVFSAQMFNFIFYLSLLYIVVTEGTHPLKWGWRLAWFLRNETCTCIALELSEAYFWKWGVPGNLRYCSWSLSSWFLSKGGQDMSSDLILSSMAAALKRRKHLCNFSQFIFPWGTGRVSGLCLHRIQIPGLGSPPMLNAWYLH